MIKIHLWVAVERRGSLTLDLVGCWVVGRQFGLSLAGVCYSFVGRHVVHSISVNYAF